MKSIIIFLSLMFLFSGCAKENTPLPPAPKDMGLAQEKYSYDTASQYMEALLKEYQIPSQCVGLNEAGTPVRVADLNNINWHNKILVYNIRYPVYGLNSIAKFRFSGTRSILEEMFPGKWLVRYEYTKEYPDKYGIPASYSVFAYSHESKQYDIFLDKCTLQEKQWGFLRFKNKIILIYIIYL